MRSRSLLISIFLTLFIFPSESLASAISGRIDAADRYAWSENAGWIDFGTTLGAVTVTDSALAGYAYGENVGWVSLNCSNTSSCASNAYAVANNSEGILTGYAWSENAGWIDFAPSAGGVSISSAGIFSGYAYSENLGWIAFAGNHPVTTDWRPASYRNAAVPHAPATRSSGSRLRNMQDSSPPAITVPSVIPLSVPASEQSKDFTRDLHIGYAGNDTRSLQIYLNSHGFPVSDTGPGSQGKETLFFGPRTQKALASFQKMNGIIPAIGYFGPKTRYYMSNH
ncbi:MAG: hypothetical protein JWO73_56 [Candidatus Taylorbacteria bacterium]|nr:hypothetical protein [Candidatus Taylorbacteria bacterium]